MDPCPSLWTNCSPLSNGVFYGHNHVHTFRYISTINSMKKISEKMAFNLSKKIFSILALFVESPLSIVQQTKPHWFQRASSQCWPFSLSPRVWMYKQYDTSWTGLWLLFRLSQSIWLSCRPASRSRTWIEASWCDIVWAYYSHNLRSWSSWNANGDEKYMELNASGTTPFWALLLVHFSQCLLERFFFSFWRK